MCLSEFQGPLGEETILVGFYALQGFPLWLEVIESSGDRIQLDDLDTEPATSFQLSRHQSCPLDLSMEALIPKPEFRTMSLEAELARASDRLKAHGYAPKGAW